MSMRAHVYAGPLVQINAGGQLSTHNKLQNFACDVLEQALWSPETQNHLYLLPNLNSLFERSYTFSEFDVEKTILNPDTEADTLWFSQQIKPYTDKFPEDTEYEIVWGMIAYWL